MIKKSYIFFSLFFILSFSVNGIPTHTIKMDKEINQQALLLNQTTIPKTVDSIMTYLWKHIYFQFYWFPRGTTTTWYEMRGDCTDVSMLGEKMLGNLNITTRIRHGFVKNQNEWLDTGHDWIEYYYNNSWHNYELEKHYWTRMFVIGEGVW